MNEEAAKLYKERNYCPCSIARGPDLLCCENYRHTIVLVALVIPGVLVVASLLIVMWLL